MIVTRPPERLMPYWPPSSRAVTAPLVRALPSQIINQPNHKISPTISRYIHQSISDLIDKIGTTGATSNTILDIIYDTFYYQKFYRSRPPCETMLDIGCGWGTLAKFASLNYSAKVTGLTIAENQTGNFGAITGKYGPRWYRMSVLRGLFFCCQA